MRILRLIALAAAFPLALAACEGDPDVQVVNPPASTVVTPGSGAVVVDDD